MGLCISTHSSSSSSSYGRSRTSKHNNKASCGGGVDYSLEAEDPVPNRWVSNGCGSVASLYTQQGKKGTNQDAMILWENFASETDSVFCGVFDGHGPYGHFVATNVRNSFPIKLLTSIINKDEAIEEEEHLHSDIDGDGNDYDMFPEVYVPLKRAIRKACKLVDKELRLHPTIDCFCSGSTAVTLLKQGHDLIIGNIGDSRAVLATRDDDNNLNAVQLTVDLKPNLPSMILFTKDYYSA